MIGVCSEACSASCTQGFFVGVVVVFSLYIGMDVLLSVLTIGERLRLGRGGEK